MSLRTRLALLLAGFVLATAGLAWLVAGHIVIRPFAREVMRAHLEQVAFIADQIEAGEDPRRLSERLDLTIEIRDEPGVRPTQRRRWRRRRCRPEHIHHRELIVCRGPRAPISAKIDRGWVVVKRDLDVARPGEQIGRFLFVLAFGVILVSVWVSRVATRPLRSTRAAIARIAAGDLDHRLPTRGPSELAELSESFNQMASRVQEMLQTERTLMAGISHELRTPLARLRLEVELLRERDVPAERLDAMEADLEEVDLLIGELLEASRLSIGERKVEKSEVDLLEIARVAIERCSTDGRNIELLGEPSRVLADHDRLVRVVSNLVENACKYAPSETTIEVRVNGRRLAVRDEGPGVPSTALDRLFEPFFRVHATGGKRGGLGLGLMIADQVVRLHGGTIEAKNLSPKGFEISFELPETP